MGFIGKALLCVIIIAVAGGFVVNQVPSLKQKVIEVINPAVKEGRILGELKTNLDQIDGLLSAEDGAGDQQILKSRELLGQSEELLNSLVQLNQDNSGILKQQVGKIIDAFTDRTPYPADHLPTASNSPTPVPCSK